MRANQQPESTVRPVKSATPYPYPRPRKQAQYVLIVHTNEQETTIRLLQGICLLVFCLLARRLLRLLKCTSHSNAKTNLRSATLVSGEIRDQNQIREPLGCFGVLYSAKKIVSPNLLRETVPNKPDAPDPQDVATMPTSVHV